MRTIVLHFTETSQGQIENALASWKASPAFSDILYPELCDVQNEELTAEYLEEIQRVLGGLPAVSLSADISGRGSGQVEVFAFVKYFLSQFHGVATDDYTNHPWLLTEIINGEKIQGHPFFDYLGWHEEQKNS